MQIKGLEAELKKQDAQEKMLKNGEEVKGTESYLQLVRNDSVLNIINVSSVFVSHWCVNTARTPRLVTTSTTQI